MDDTSKVFFPINASLRIERVVDGRGRSAGKKTVALSARGKNQLEMLEA
jgi:hypothetical protein